MPDPNRIRSIFQKHVAALSREIAEELTQELAQPLAERWGISLVDANPSPTVAVSTVEPVSPAALIYDARARKWTCPKCRAFSDVRRRAVTTHLRFCTQTFVVPSTATASARKSKKKKS